MLLRVALFGAALLAGCPGPQPVAACAKQHAAGDASQPMALEAFTVVNGKAVLLHDGDAIPLTVPSQGGFVLYTGVRARNLLACGALVAAQLVDPDTGQSMSNLDQRSEDLIEEPDGYFQPSSADLQSEVPNIPACPDQLGKGVAGRSAILQLRVQDAAGKRGQIEVHVVPTCPASSATCACVCGPNYHPGGC